MKNAETAPLAGICCPLPKGVLGEDFMFVASECPETYVVTGARVPKMIFSPITNDVHVSWQQTWKYLRCTRINTARYRLGPPRKALFVDWGSHFSNVFAERTTLGRIPAAFRYAVMRRDRSNWLVQDCVGYPWGSLMSAKLGGRCNFRFRQLQYAGATEDPPAGTPVQLYPDCRTISSPFEENARCLQ